jgi:hypothetical protein
LALLRGSVTRWAVNGISAATLKRAGRSGARKTGLPQSTSKWAEDSSETAGFGGRVWGCEIMVG